MQAPTPFLRESPPPEQQVPRLAALAEHEQLGGFPLHLEIRTTDSTMRKLLLLALCAPPEQQAPRLAGLGECRRSLAARARLSFFY